MPWEAPSMPKPGAVMMVKPTHFNIGEAINPHMLQANGQAQTIDTDTAYTQWDTLKNIYNSLGFPVHVCSDQPGLCDMVFAANQCLPYTHQGMKIAFLSNMATQNRNKEVVFIKNFLEHLGYTTQSLDPTLSFEGMGDFLWVPGKNFGLGGYGYRTSQHIYDDLTQRISNTPIATFQLTNPKFYHLDTCLSVLSPTHVLACQEGFTAEGWELLQALFPYVIAVPTEEADMPFFACNAHCVDGKHVILQQGSERTHALLKTHGFSTLSVETGEFIKSGGSVFCLKLMLF